MLSSTFFNRLNSNSTHHNYKVNQGYCHRNRKFSLFQSDKVHRCRRQKMTNHKSKLIVGAYTPSQETSLNFKIILIKYNGVKNNYKIRIG